MLRCILWSSDESGQRWATRASDSGLVAQCHVISTKNSLISTYAERYTRFTLQGRGAKHFFILACCDYCVNIMFQSQLRHRTSWTLHDIGTSWRHWCVCSLVITVRHRLYRSFQSRPTSQSIMISLKYTLACRLHFFQLFPKNVIKSSPKQGSRWCWYHWLIQL